MSFSSSSLSLFHSLPPLSCPPHPFKEISFQSISSFLLNCPRFSPSYSAFLLFWSLFLASTNLLPDHFFSFPSSSFLHFFPILFFSFLHPFCLFLRVPVEWNKTTQWMKNLFCRILTNFLTCQRFFMSLNYISDILKMKKKSGQSFFWFYL